MLVNARNIYTEQICLTLKEGFAMMLWYKFQIKQLDMVAAVNTKYNTSFECYDYMKLLLSNAKYTTNEIY